MMLCLYTRSLSLGWVHFLGWMHVFGWEGWDRKAGSNGYNDDFAMHWEENGTGQLEWACYEVHVGHVWFPGCWLVMI